MAVGAEPNTASISPVNMTLEHFLPILLKIAFTVINEHLVVHRLPGPVLPTRVHGRGGYRIHVGLTDMFGHHRDSEFPEVNLLIVSC